MKLEKLKLEVDFEFEYEVWGIATPSSDYKFVWLINKILDINLVRTEKDWEIDDKKLGMLLSFNCFHYYDCIEWTDFYLIKNKCFNQFLLPELKNFDYIFKIEGNIHTEYTEKIYSTIRQLPDIQLMKSFEPKDLKSNLNLLYQ